jgi:hypothetical protein
VHHTKCKLEDEKYVSSLGRSNVCRVCGMSMQCEVRGTHVQTQTQTQTTCNWRTGMMTKICEPPLKTHPTHSHTHTMHLHELNLYVRSKSKLVHLHTIVRDLPTQNLLLYKSQIKRSRFQKVEIWHITKHADPCLSNVYAKFND